LGGDAGSDDDRDEQAGADGFGEQPPRQGDRSGCLQTYFNNK